jgi:hypothetical protein
VEFWEEEADRRSRSKSQERAGPAAAARMPGKTDIQIQGGGIMDRLDLLIASV